MATEIHSDRPNLRRSQHGASQVSARAFHLVQQWWARWDSNPESKDYESSALTIKLQALAVATLSRQVKVER